MQQLFSTRNYSIRDFQEWNERDELILAPDFQRREVWSDKARSYLIDTIIRGKPIPKIYMRQEIDLKSRRTAREIVDGQQRLRTVLTFLKDGFKISKAHHEEFGGKYYSDIDNDTQRDILKYEFVVDLLQDMPNNEVYDVFARINTYAEKLKPQELRNARWFGEFKSSVYLLAKEFKTFVSANKLFTPKQVLRMAEAEFISELLLATHEGIREKQIRVIDNCYKKYDDVFPNRKLHEKRFLDTIDVIGGIAGKDLAELKFRATRLFYPLFCAIYHLKYGIPRIRVVRISIRAGDYSKLKTAMERIDEMIGRIDAAKEKHEEITLSSEDRKFYDAYNKHWVHADKRTILTEYICKRFIIELKG